MSAMNTIYNFLIERLFGAPKLESELENLNKIIQMLQKQERLVLSKVGEEHEKAKGHVRSDNKRAAMQCLKMKKLYDHQLEVLGDLRIRLTEQKIMLEDATLTSQALDAMISGASGMKKMKKSVNINLVDKTTGLVTDQTQNMKQINEALSAAALFNEEVLNDEFKLLQAETHQSKTTRTGEKA